MKASQIIAQLQALLPKYTNLFSDEINVSSITYSAGIVTVTTNQSHGLNTNDFVNISGATTPTPISSLTQTGNIATAITSVDHDLTFEPVVTDLNVVNISGATQNDYNGEKILLSVPSRTTFTFQIANNPVSPATGSPIINETIINQYNGWHQITRTGSRTFTYTITGTPASPATGTIKLRKNVRVTGMATEEKMMDIYTKQLPDELWAFVILGESFANKDRNVLGDETAEKIAPTDKRQKIIQNFSIYTIDPAKTSYSGREARDRTQDIRVLLVKTLVNAYFDSGFNEGSNYGVSYIGDDIADYSNAYYVHKFDFQSTVELNIDDMVKNEDSKAWRDFIVNYERDADTYVKKQDIGELP